MTTATEDAPAGARRTSVRESIVCGTDREHATAFYRGLYGADELRFGSADLPGATGFAFRYRSTGDGSVTLRTSSVAASSVGRFEPAREYVLAWTVGGAVTVDDDRDEAVSLRAGVPVMLPAQRPFHATATAGTVHLVHFDADFLEAVSVVGTEAAPAPLAFPVEVSQERLHPLQTVLREVARPLLDVTVTDGDRAVLDLRLAEAALDAFRPLADGSPSAPVGTVARAKAYMDAHFDRQLTATAVASAVGVSVRTLQESFQREDDSTPMTYLRDVRLEKARLGLQLADPHETSVAAVAQSCGFRHMGRFSGAYLATYGEYPGDTLRGRTRLVGLRRA